MERADAGSAALAHARRILLVFMVNAICVSESEMTSRSREMSAAERMLEVIMGRQLHSADYISAFP